MSPKSFSVRIFLQDGTVDGVKFIAKSKWIGRGMVIPRPLLQEELARDELNAPGIYILIGPADEGDLPTLAIGSDDPVSRSLKQHDAETDFWTWAIVSNAKKGELGQPTIQYLAARLVQIIEETKGAHLVKSGKAQPPVLSAEEQAEAETFLEHLLSICPIIGLRAFEQSQS